MHTRLLALGFLAGAASRGRGPVRLGPVLRAMASAWQTRRMLAAMDDRALRDIGISRSEALREAERWPWDLGPRGT